MDLSFLPVKESNIEDMVMNGTHDLSLCYTLPFQLTKKIHRRVYDQISAAKPANKQHGKIVLITGGGTGIGAAAAKVWVHAEAEGVVICGRRPGILERTAEKLRQLSDQNAYSTKILAVPADITSFGQMESLYSEIKAVFGRTADVVIANAGWTSQETRSGDVDPDIWWNAFEVNTRGLHNTVTAFIGSQDCSTDPSGTVVHVNSGIAGIVQPGTSGYAVSKLAAQRYIEFVAAEYPSLRTFSLLPGVVKTDMLPPAYEPFAQDDAELTGSLCLYLAQPRADFLKGSLVSINWDVDEIESHKDEIQSKNMLRTTWIPVLPCCGGHGL